MELSAVKVPVADLQRASDFYVQHVDMVAGAKVNKWEWELRATSDAATRVLLYSDPGDEHGFEFGRAWLLLRVDDAVAAGDRLRVTGVPVEEPRIIRDGTVTLVFAEDPDGNIIEFISPTR